MKSILKIFLRGALALTAVFVSTNAQARIGETRNDMQARMMTKSGGAYFYPSKEERFREAMELPYKYAFLLMPKDSQNYFFFKRSDTSTTTTSDTVQQHDLHGWELHFCFLDNVSTMEFYRRHGEPITLEELSEIFNSQLASKENGFWKKSEFVNVVKQWEMKVQKGGTPVYRAPASKNIADILPKSSNRFIYVEVPEEVKDSTDYNQSLASQIMEYEQRNAYDAYRKYLNKQSSITAAKTAPSSYKNKKNNAPATNSSVRKIYSFDGYTQRYVESEFANINEGSVGNMLNRTAYMVGDLFYGGSPITTPTKDVRITMSIPNQPDTAFGFDYISSDGSVRAKIYKSGVLFIDSKFDAKMRGYMEKLYKEQSEKRLEEAKASTAKF